jgi:hypothetical protein
VGTGLWRPGWRRAGTLRARTAALPCGPRAGTIARAGDPWARAPKGLERSLSSGARVREGCPVELLRFSPRATPPNGLALPQTTNRSNTRAPRFKARVEGALPAPASGVGTAEINADRGRQGMSGIDVATLSWKRNAPSARLSVHGKVGPRRHRATPDRLGSRSRRAAPARSIDACERACAGTRGRARKCVALVQSVK